MAIDSRALRRPFQMHVAGLLALACGACTVGPDPHRPDVDAPAAWAASRDTRIASDLPGRIVPGSTDAHRWWTVFDDPVLDGLIETATARSLDVEVAGLRIAEARAQRDAAAGKFYPSVNSNSIGARTRMGDGGFGQLIGGSASGGASSSSSPSSSSSESSSISTSLFQVGFDATWEPDLFGRTRRTVQAAGFDIRSAEEQRRDALVSLAAEIARDYLTLRGAERQRAITQADIASQVRLGELIGSRNRAGLAPSSDVATQQVQVSLARSKLPPIEQNIATSRNRLALLLAMPPGALDERLGTGSLPALPPQIPVGVPGDLLRRRPDVRRREADFEAATARIGVAKAALFPSVRFAAVGGFTSNQGTSLFDWASRLGLIGAQLSIPIFQGGQLQSQLRVADLRAQEAAVTYRQTVLGAFHDVDNAMTTYALEQRRTADLGRQLDDTKRGRDLARARYDSGLGAYLDVLSAEHRARQAELDYAQSTVTATTDLVALFKALGGGWDEADADAR